MTHIQRPPANPGRFRQLPDDRNRLALTVGLRDGIQTAALDEDHDLDAGFDIGG